MTLLRLLRCRFTNTYLGVFGIILAAGTYAACSSDPATDNERTLPLEAGYALGTESECAPILDALKAPAALLSADMPPVRNGRTALEDALADRVHSLLERQCYKLPGWEAEDGVHLTGAAGHGDTHGWVRVIYSPDMVGWLRAGRPAGAVPAGAIIIKERYVPLDAEHTKFKLVAFQPMIRRPDDAKDGWFWAEFSQAEVRHGEVGCSRTPLEPATAFDSEVSDCRPTSGFGEPCLRCHASAPSDLTYSQLAHLPEITGGIHAREQTIYDYRRRWLPSDEADASLGHAAWVNSEPSPYVASHPDRALMPRKRTDVDPSLASLFFPNLDATGSPLLFPQRSQDRVWMPAGDPTLAGSFVTSNQCWACHSGVPHVAMDTVDYASGTLLRHTPGQSMIVESGTFDDGRTRYADVSPFGGWSVSMMGLAGKDPVFFAQREWEADSRPECAEDATNLCFACHGAAGKRQLEIDRPGAKFTQGMLYAEAKDPDAKYGALARDGVSCMVCHRMAADGLGTPASYTGNFRVAAAGELHGPFSDDVRADPMKNAMGLEPRGDGLAGETIKSSAMCGSCHAVRLPVYKVGTCEKIGDGYEQATFLEWRNSDYRRNDRFVTDEGHDGASPKACRDCHMPTSHGGKPLESKIASIEDSDFPTGNLGGLNAVHEQEVLKSRRPFSEHSLKGINLFALGMFQQFPRALGISDYDYMSNQFGEPIGLQMKEAIDAGKRMAMQDTATVEIESATKTATDLEVLVKITNLTGHRLPTGVSFRRVILGVGVVDAGGAVLWRSGQTDARGLVVGADGTTPLPTELSVSQLEPHHDVITDEGQAQIYEERARDSQGNLTTSFLGIAEHSKDNRLLPRGFKRNFAPTMENGVVPAGLEPHGVSGDPDFDAEPSCGCDHVRYRIPLARITTGVNIQASLAYQALPPYYLRDRFTIAHKPDSQRLMQLVAHLDTSTDAGGIKGWRVLVGQASRAVP